jgi:oligopeptidase B
MALFASSCAAPHQGSPGAPIPVTPQTAAVGAAMPPPPPVPPVAAKKPYEVPSPNGARADDYYWLRDDTRQSAEVIDYLNKENAYRDAVMAPTEALQQKLYDELVGRLKPDDSSVPAYEHGYWYYIRFAPGLDYPVYARRKGSLAAPEQVMLEGNDMAKGHEYFRIGDTEISPDAKLLAYTEDDVGRRQYTLRIKNLDTGVVLADAMVSVEPKFVWAADNKTLLYTMAPKTRCSRKGEAPAAS